MNHCDKLKQVKAHNRKEYTETKYKTFFQTRLSNPCPNATQSHWWGLLVYFLKQKFFKKFKAEEDHLNKITYTYTFIHIHLYLTKLPEQNLTDICKKEFQRFTMRYRYALLSIFTEIIFFLGNLQCVTTRYCQNAIKK